MLAPRHLLNVTRHSEMDIDGEKTPIRSLAHKGYVNCSIPTLVAEFTSRGGSQTRRVLFAPPDSPASETVEDTADLERSPETASQLLATQKSKALIAARTVIPSTAFRTCKSSSSNRYEYDAPPPSATSLIQTLEELGLPRRLYRPPHYSDDSDLPDTDQEFGGRLFRLKGGQGIATLDEWVNTVPERTAWSDLHHSKILYPPGVAGWEYAVSPPSVREVRKTINLLIPIGDASLGRKNLRSQVC